MARKDFSFDDNEDIVKEEEESSIESKEGEFEAVCIVAVSRCRRSVVTGQGGGRGGWRDR